MYQVSGRWIPNLQLKIIFSAAEIQISLAAHFKIENKGIALFNLNRMHRDSPLLKFVSEHCFQRMFSAHVFS